jgi:DNA uptake protein ComE-like DNA-binding protein
VPPASVRAALGLPLSLNRVAEADLARLPGVGPEAARALVQARPFRSWGEVDAVRGVGPARLRLLQQATELDP